jgi:hypothetical protein
MLCWRFIWLFILFWIAIVIFLIQVNYLFLNSNFFGILNILFGKFLILRIFLISVTYLFHEIYHFIIFLIVFNLTFRHVLNAFSFFLFLLRAKFILIFILIPWSLYLRLIFPYFNLLCTSLKSLFNLIVVF